MTQFIDANVRFSLDIRGEVYEIDHSSETLEEKDHYRILKLTSKQLLPKRYSCAEGECPGWFDISKDGTNFDNETPVCPSCDDDMSVVIKNNLFFCQFEHCEEYITPHCPTCNGRVDILEEELTDSTMIAIQSRIHRKDSISDGVKELIKEESSYVSQSGDNKNNPYSDIDENDWYEHKRLSLGFKLDNYSRRPRPWLYSMAEIAKAKYWTHRGEEDLLTDSKWCVDGPFFLHPNRNELDSRSPVAIQANVSILKMVVKCLVGPLVEYHRSNGLEVPLKTPFDSMIIKHCEQPKPSRTGLRTKFSKIIEENTQPWFLIPYYELFGGYPLYVDGSGTPINPNVAWRIPDYWLLPDGIRLVDWLSNNADLTKWNSIPARISRIGTTILDNDSSPVLMHVPRISGRRIVQ